MGEVVILDVETRLDIPAERILEAAKQDDLETAMVIGVDADGELYVRTTTTKAKELIWLMELAKQLVMDQFKDG